MAFFKKLKDRLFKSSSKIEDGLDAIVEDGGVEEQLDVDLAEAETAEQEAAEQQAAAEEEAARKAAAEQAAQAEAERLRGVEEERQGAVDTLGKQVSDGRSRLQALTEESRRSAAALQQATSELESSVSSHRLVDTDDSTRADTDDSTPCHC